MFFMKEMSLKLRILPKDLGKELLNVIQKRLCEEVEGKMQPGHAGFVVCVQDVKEIGKGHIINEGSGQVEFAITFNAILYRPFVNEVVDGTVVDVSPLGFWCEVRTMHDSVPSPTGHSEPDSTP